MIDEKVLTAIEQAGKEVTPRPWEIDPLIDGITIWAGIGGVAEVYRSTKDAKFIVLAANHVLDLVAEVRRLQAQETELRDAVAHPAPVEEFIDNLTDIVVEQYDRADKAEIERLQLQQRLAHIHLAMEGVTEVEVLDALKSPETETGVR